MAKTDYTRNFVTGSPTQYTPRTDVTWSGYDKTLWTCPVSDFNNFGLKAGDKISFRVYIYKPTEPCYGSLNFINNNDATIFVAGTTVATSGSDYSTCTFTLTAEQLSNLKRVTFSVKNSKGTTCTAGIHTYKLNAGELSDWTPAPEDIL